MTKFVRSIFLVAVAFGFSTVVMAPAAMADAHVVKQQKAFMKELSGHNKKIAAYLKGHKDLKREKRLGNHEDVEFLAIAIQDLAKRMPAMFKKGSPHMGNHPTSRSKEAIWKDWAKFKKAAKNMEMRAKDIEQAALTGSKAKIMAAYEGFAKSSCGGCHKPFRGPKRKKK